MEVKAGRLPCTHIYAMDPKGPEYMRYGPQRVKVLEVKEMVGKRKQDIIIVNQTGTAKVSFWLMPLETVHVTSLRTSSFEIFSQHNISLCPKKEPNHGTVAQQSDTEEVITLQNVIVIRVPHLYIYII